MFTTLLLWVFIYHKERKKYIIAGRVYLNFIIGDLRHHNKLRGFNWDSKSLSYPEFYLVLCVCFVDRCLSFCPFSFGHCVVWSSSIYTDSDYSFGFFKLFLCTWFVNPTFFILLYFFFTVVALSVLIVNCYILYMILLYSFCLSGVWIFMFTFTCVNLF